MALLVPQFSIQELIGAKNVEIDAATVGDLLRKAAERWGDEFARRAKAAAVFVNGRNINFLKGRDTPLSQGDVVWLLVPAAGG